MKRLGAVALAWLVVLLGCRLGQPAFAQEAAGIGTLIVVVPEDAKVQVNGNPTDATGTKRTFVSKGLQPGYDYPCTVRAQVVREGRTLEQAKTVQLQAGQTVEVVFTFPAGTEGKTGTKKEPTPAPKSKEKEKPSGWKPAKESTSGSPSKGPPTTTQGTPSGTGKKPAGTGSPPLLVGPGVGGPEKKSTWKPGEKLPGTVTPGTKGTEPAAGKKLPSKPIVHKVPMVEQYLVDGKLAQGEKDLGDRLRQNPRDDEARASLGAIQFFLAVEKFSQALYLHGYRTPEVSIGGLELKLLRLPVKPHPKPLSLSYLNARETLKRFVGDLGKVEETLKDISDRDMKLPLHIGLAKLDLTGGVQLTGDLQKLYPLWWIYAKLSGRTNLSESEAQKLQSEAQKFLVCFDYGDVLWLRGYCHFLMAVGEMVLAYDEQELFEQAGNLLFAQAVTSRGFLVQNPEKLQGRLANGLVVALQSLVKLKLEEPERMAAAMKHLRATLDLSRQSWNAILAETDDDFEWIPNPKQHGAIPNLKVTDTLVAAWLKAIDEADAVLAGKKLAPPLAAAQPGGNDGINISEVFSPRPPVTFDLILWLNGNGAGRFAQKGTLTDPKVWRGLQDAFGRDFPLYLLWFN